MRTLPRGREPCARLDDARAQHRWIIGRGKQSTGRSRGLVSPLLLSDRARRRHSIHVWRPAVRSRFAGISGLRGLCNISYKAKKMSIEGSPGRREGRQHQRQTKTPVAPGHFYDVCRLTPRALGKRLGVCALSGTGRLRGRLLPTLILDAGRTRSGFLASGRSMRHRPKGRPSQEPCGRTPACPVQYKTDATP